MNAEEYQSTLDVSQLLQELKRLLLFQRSADRLICRYLADLADGVVKWPALMLAYGNVYEFVRATFGLSVRSARERIRIGRALRTLPILDAALTSGQIAYSSIREVTRVATLDTERVWLQAAQRLSVHALERRVAEASGKVQSRPPRPQQKEATEATEASDPRNVNVSVPREVWTLVIQAIHAVKAVHGSELSNWQALAEVARSVIASHTPVSTDRIVERNGLAADRMSSPTHSGSRSEAAAEQLTSVPVSSERDRATESPSESAPEPLASCAPAGGDPPATHSGSRNEPSASHDDGHTAATLSEFAGNTEQGLSNGLGEAWGAAATQGGFELPAAAREQQPATVSRGEDVRDKRLSADAQLLFDLISTGGDWNMATLAVVTEMPESRLADALVDLEFSGMARRDVMGFFEVTIKQAG